MKPARFARIVTAAELPIILAIAPALLFPTPRRLAVLAVVPVIWLSAKVDSGHCVPRTPMNAALSLMLAMVGVSLYATFDVQFSLGKVSGVVLGALLFWAIARWLTTAGRLKMGTLAFLLAGVGLAVVGLLGTAGSIKIPVLGAIALRLPLVIRGVPGAEQGFNPNAVAGCLVLFVPLQVSLLAAHGDRWGFPRAKSRPTRTCLVVTQVIMLMTTVGALLLMQSRGALAGLAAAAIAFLIWHSRGTRVVATVALGTLALLATTLGPQRMFDIANSRRDEADRARPGLASTISSREELWSRALYGIQDFPFTGMGMNTFRSLVPVRYPILQAPIGFDVVHAHNHLLEAALDLGIPGLVAYVSIWLIAAALLMNVYRCCREQTYRMIAGGLGAGLIAHFIFGMTDAISLGAKLGVLFWLTLALVVGLHRVACLDARLQPCETRTQ